MGFPSFCIPIFKDKSPRTPLDVTSVTILSISATEPDDVISPKDELSITNLIDPPKSPICAPSVNLEDRIKN